jgi:hypothetical protein
MKNSLLKMLLILLITLLEVTPVFSQATIETGSMGIVVNAYGRIRVYTPNATSGLKHIERISPLVGVSQDAVFDYQNDMDTEEPTTLVSNPQLSDFEITGAYNNAYSAAPPDVLVKYNVYSWNNAKYGIVKWTIVNRESSSINAKIGLDVIMSLDNTYGYDTVTFDQSSQTIITHRGGVNSGLKMLSHPLQSLYSFEWYANYFVDSSYWSWLNYGSIQNEYIGDVEGPVTIPSIDFVNIPSGDSIVFFFAMALGENSTDVLSQINEAVIKYNTVLNADDPISDIPTGFNLEQNYPNPFNPSTRIQYAISERQFVQLKVYDLLGNEVATLVNEEKEPGIYKVDFNAGQTISLSSGVYFYRLVAGEFVQTKKMILTK